MNAKLTLPLYVGQKYITRDGRKARVLATDIKGSKQIAVAVGSVFEQTEDPVLLYTLGEFSLCESGLDLVADDVAHMVPKEVTVRLYKDGIGGIVSHSHGRGAVEDYLGDFRYILAED
jgi:hypothetical protein